jgi:hypothetical protein
LRFLASLKKAERESSSALPKSAPNDFDGTRSASFDMDWDSTAEVYLLNKLRHVTDGKPDPNFMFDENEVIVRSWTLLFAHFQSLLGLFLRKSAC